MNEQERNGAGVCLRATDDQAVSLLRLREALDVPGARFAAQLRADGSRAVVAPTGRLLAQMDAAGFSVEFYVAEGWRRVDASWAPLDEVRPRPPVAAPVARIVVNGTTRAGVAVRVEGRASMEFKVWVAGVEMAVAGVRRWRDGGSTEIRLASGGRVYLNRRVGAKPSDFLNGQEIR